MCSHLKSGVIPLARQYRTKPTENITSNVESHTDGKVGFLQMIMVPCWPMLLMTPHASVGLVY